MLILLGCVLVTLFSHNRAFATLWEELSPEEVEERADVIVKGKFDFSAETTYSEQTGPYVGVQFEIEEDYKGNFFNEVTAGIDYNDLSRIREFQKNDGEFLLFLKSTPLAILGSVGGPNGVVFIKNGEVKNEDKKSKEYFEEFLGLNDKSNSGLLNKNKYMNFLIVFLAIWGCSFIIARVISLLGFKWSPFGNTCWKNDAVITFAQALIITVVFIFLANS